MMLKTHQTCAKTPLRTGSSAQKNLQVPGRKSTQEFEARLAMLPMGLGGLRRAVGYRRSLQRSGPRLETPKPKPENPDPQP